MSPELTEHLWDLRAYHANAVTNLTMYADDSGLRDSDIRYYRKRADIHSVHVVTIDALLALGGGHDQSCGN